MRRQIEGSRAIAETVAACRPQVIPAYPITPQTHIVEGLGVMVKDGRLAPCQFITVESEFAAMSAALGASATGSRAYTATASQGLLYMAEVLYNVSGLGLPVVMTVANRAIGAPINIWNDHSDSMSQRDCGWIQLYAEDNQAAVELHVLAFRLAEQLSVPVMVCVDGFVLTHAVEPIEVPSQDLVDRFLPPYSPRQVLDPADPCTIGAMVGPEAFTEVRVLTHLNQLRAIETFRDLAAAYGSASGHPQQLVSSYRAERAGVVLFTIGSVTGTVRDLADDLAEEGQPVGVVSLTMYRPFPAAEVRAALAHAHHVIVLERAFAPGAGGVVTPDVVAALTGLPTRVTTVVAGLGGRAVTKAGLRSMLADDAAGRLPAFSFLDVDNELVDREVARWAAPHTALLGAGRPASRIG
jgi:pyruvate ferredoxin oxidoreductase alpha subunit